MQKLGLRQFHNVGPLDDTLLPTEQVGIKLKQHVGAPCEPLVAAGQRVRQGAKSIGRPPVDNGKPALGRSRPRLDRRHGHRPSRDGIVWIEKHKTYKNRYGTPKAIGAIELSSIGLGYQVEDDMLKAASVELLIARTICSGKYLIVIGGSVSDVEAAHASRRWPARGEAIIDHLMVANVHEAVFPALGPIGGARAGRGRGPGRAGNLQRRERVGRGRRGRQGRRA